MGRRSTPIKKVYERRFPDHRVDLRGDDTVGIPNLREINAWCRDRLGKSDERWASFGARFYFDTAADAEAFRKRWVEPSKNKTG